MASNVKLDAAALETAREMANRIKCAANDCSYELTWLLYRLDDEYTSISQNTEYFGYGVGVESIKKKLDERVTDMLFIWGDLRNAVEEANKTTDDLNAALDSFRLFISQMKVSDVAAGTAKVNTTNLAASSLAASAAFGSLSLGNWWTDLTSWIMKFFTTVQETVEKVAQNGTQTPKVILNTVAQRNKDILDAKDSDLPSVATNSRYNNAEKQINCRWLARQKMCKIIGEDDLFTGKMVGTGKQGKNFQKYESTGINGHAVDYVNAGGVSMASLKETLLEKQPCSILFYMNGHEVTVDKIVDGKVYFSDNFNTGAGYTTGVSDAEVLYKANSKGKWVPTVATGQSVCVSFDAFADSYDTYASKQVLSYVVVK